MKNCNQSLSTIQNEFLQGILKQLINEHYIIREILFNTVITSKHKYLIICMEYTADMEVLRKQPWVEKAFKEYQVKVFFFYTTRLKQQLSLGQPLFELYFKSSTVVYRNEIYKEPIYQQQDWKKFKKKFNTYENGFYHDHDLLLSQVNSFMSENSSLSVVLAFEKLLAYDLEYLENLHLGTSSDKKDLNKRIKALSLHIPEIQKIFVTQHSDSYYLLSLCEEVKKGSTEDDTIYIDEMYQAFTIAEKSLYGLIQERFEKLKKLIKSSIPEQDEFEISLDSDKKDEILEKAVKIITDNKEIEEIYIYNKFIYGEITTYYLLLIGYNVSNDFLRNIRYKIRSKTTKKYDFVIIAHDRQWIQKKLFIHQGFFEKIIQIKNKIYESNPFHPEPHWEYPHDGSFGFYQTLKSFYGITDKCARQITQIIESVDKNHQGLPYLFSLFFLSFCKTYIFAKLFYEPHYLPSHFLWKLCLYANPELKKVEYQFDEFRLKFFTFLDHNRTLHHRADIFEKGDLDTIKSITVTLMNELRLLENLKSVSYSNESVE
ncbi:hypothetical protein SAMN05421856_10575 [Chryseobacterium taichungense]|uniref:Uncharacterized protein n=1 Tax=Chryseobacterium taichungense TaxID=295069 RepID=A0A1H8A3C1_9FLAO|nr:hypothetical protein [Chryseobacterium taichungense]SEM65091.1 hypothetical protein SAMN05421856_10575 [Chryseobacterium taichungense]